MIFMGVRGLEKTIRNIRKHPKRLLDIADYALLEGIQFFTVPLAKQLAPKDTRWLENSIRAEPIDFLVVKFLCDAPYAVWQEYGFNMTYKMLRAMAAKGILKPSGTPKDYPHWVQNPFMHPAADETSEDVKKYIYRRLQIDFPRR